MIRGMTIDQGPIPTISRRLLLGATVASAFALTQLSRAVAAVMPTVNQILGRPTRDSIAVSLLASQAGQYAIDYGYSKTKYASTTTATNVATAMPAVIDLRGLKPNSTVYYRVKYRPTSSSAWSYGKQQIFRTARNAGSTFSFTVQGDTHPERVGKMFNSDLYFVTMANIASQRPDFHILMGDDFSIDPIIGKGQATAANVDKVYATHRNWLGVVGASVPIFLVNGNHEQAAQYLLDGTTTNPAVLAGASRVKYYPLPTSDGFYNADRTVVDGVGELRDYYAWTWGDALFVTLDPYWHSKTAVDNVAGVSNDAAQTAKKSGGAGAKTTNLWQIGIGDEQYAWLTSVLEGSKAKYKFVFAHHVMGTGRGGVEVSTNYEWGGKDPKGQTTFAEQRPNWELPIHDLMVKHGVSIFFQGHDHIFVTQERDGVIYQSMPNPADDTFSMFNADAYKTGVKAPNSGHVRVTVGPSGAKVEYFLAARPSDSSANRKNLQLAHSYIVKPKA